MVCLPVYSPINQYSAASEFRQVPARYIPYLLVTKVGTNRMGNSLTVTNGLSAESFYL